MPDMLKNKASNIVKLLRKEFKLPARKDKTRETFETLIATVISQNTNDRNTAAAFERLSKKFKIKPAVLSKADVRDVEEALRVGGLHHKKARVIKNLAGVVLEDFDGSLDFVSILPLEQARRKLLALPGVGPKTADVVLLFSAGRSTIPIDTHVNRVSKRLALVNSKADYESVRKKLQWIFNPQDYYSVHILLISHGRRYCRARNPKCRICPLGQLCSSKRIKC